jgi:alkylation response protein AidB-like acyl-CoA dehydrogenase
MLDYKAPLRDLRFVYYELFDAGELVRLPGFEEATPDVVMAIAEEMGRFASEVLRPINASGDEEGCKLENGAVKTATGFKEAYAKYREGGWPGLEAPPAYGGQGLPYSVGTMLTEITCAANLSFSMMAALTLGAINAMRHSATEELKQRFLPKLIDGVWSATMCLTEPQAGTDLGLVRMRAEPNADGSYKLTGGKIFISAGDHDMTENIVHLVLARLPDAPPGIKGISLFVIPKLREEGAKLVPNGVTCASIEHKLGIKASATCSIDFDGSTGWLVGEPNKA